MSKRQQILNVNKIILITILLICYRGAYSQKPNTKSVYIWYVQPPSVPLDPELKTYYQYTSNQIPSLDEELTNSYYDLKFNGYKRVSSKEDADILVQLSLQKASFESSVDKATYSVKVNDSTYVKKEGGQFKVIAYLTSGYIIKDLKNDRTVVTKSNIHHKKEFESKIYKTYNEAVHAVNKGAALKAKDLYKEIYDIARKEFLTFLNDTYGYPLKGVSVPIARGKGKKHDYSDLQLAFDNLSIVAEQSKGKELSEQQIDVLTKNIENYQQAIDEYQPNKKARIGDNILGNLYLNIGAHFFLLGDFEKSLINLDKAKDTKGIRAKTSYLIGIINDLQERTKKQNL